MFMNWHQCSLTAARLLSRSATQNLVSGSKQSLSIKFPVRRTFSTSSPFFSRGFRRDGRSVMESAIDKRRLAIAAAAGASLVGVCAYGLMSSASTGTKSSSSALSALDQAVVWPAYVRERVHATYAYVLGTIALTGATATALIRSPAFTRMALSGGWAFPIGMMVVTIGSQILCRSLPYPAEGGLSTKHAAWALYAATLGGTIAPLILVVGSAVMTQAAVYTGAIVGGLSLVAATAPSDRFLTWAGPLSIGFGVVLAASLGSVFMSPASRLGFGLHAVSLYGGLLLFSGFLLYDTQRVVQRAQAHPPPLRGPAPAYPGLVMQQQFQPFDPINSSIHLTMDVLNIFVRIVQIVANGGNKRK